MKSFHFSHKSSARITNVIGKLRMTRPIGFVMSEMIGGPHFQNYFDLTNFTSRERKDKFTDMGKPITIGSPHPGLSPRVDSVLFKSPLVFQTAKSTHKPVNQRFLSIANLKSGLIVGFPCVGVVREVSNVKRPFSVNNTSHVPQNGIGILF